MYQRSDAWFNGLLNWAANIQPFEESRFDSHRTPFLSFFPIFLFVFFLLLNCWHNLDQSELTFTKNFVSLCKLLSFLIQRALLFNFVLVLCFMQHFLHFILGNNYPKQSQIPNFYQSSYNNSNFLLIWKTP